MTTAVYELSVDWDGDLDFNDLYENITGDLMTVECRRGRDYASQLTGRATAGRLVATLLNTDGKYSSFNSASPITGNILPGRRVRLGIRQAVNIEGVTETPDASLTTINVRGLTETENPLYTTYNVTGVTETPDAGLETINIVGLTGTYTTGAPIWYAVGVSEAAAAGSVLSAVLWTGYLDRIMPSAPLGGLQTATLEASGALIKLNGKQVTPAAQASQTTGTIIGAILDNAGWPAGDRVLDTGQTTVTRWYVDQKDAINSIREAEETELGWVYEGLAFDLVFEDRHHRLKSPHSASQATFSDTAGGGTYGYRDIEQQDPLREIYNEAVATVAPLVAVGSSSILWTLRNETPTIYIGETKSWWAEYPNAEVGGTDGAYVATWDTPVVGTDITQTGVANGDLAVAVSKFANSMKVSITNNGAATCTITLLQAKGDPVTRQSPVRVSDENATSQTAYGVRTYRLPGPWLPNTDVARDFVRYLVSRYKNPLPVLNLSIRANSNDDLMTQALTRAISDRITVTANTAKTQLGIDDDFFIESISHRISQAGTLHDVVFELSDASGDGGWWAIGFGAIGSSAKFAY